MSEKIEQKGKSLKGPKIGTPDVALDGFIKSNNLKKSDIYKKKIDKGEFYFAEIKPKTIKIFDQLQTIIPETIQEHSWKMPKGRYALNSILLEQCLPFQRFKIILN